MKQQLQRRLAATAAAALLVAGACSVLEEASSSGPLPGTDTEQRAGTVADHPTHVVTRVIDGDTLEVEGGHRVRLVGIDAPERGECGFQAATDALADLIGNREVTLVAPPGRATDRYGRWLRYVDVDGADANLALVTQGHAIARYDSLDGYPRHPRQDTYRAADAATTPWGGCER